MSVVPWIWFVPLYALQCFTYLVLGVNSGKKVRRAVLKCLPVASLFVLVIVSLLYTETVGRTERNSTSETSDGSFDARRKSVQIRALVFGLLFSCVGDAGLVFPPYGGVIGVLSFAVAQLIYSYMFGLSFLSLMSLPLHGFLSGVCVAILFVVVYLVYHRFLQSLPGYSAHVKRVPFHVTVMVNFYFALVSVMLWSSILNVQLRGWSASSALGVVGAASFYISDLLIAVSAVWNVRLLQGRVLVMLTYYLAQLLFVMSVFIA